MSFASGPKTQRERRRGILFGVIKKQERNYLITPMEDKLLSLVLEVQEEYSTLGAQPCTDFYGLSIPELSLIRSRQEDRVRRLYEGGCSEYYYGTPWMKKSWNEGVWKRKRHNGKSNSIATGC